MPDKSLMTLTQTECSILYKELLDNSKNKWEEAQILASHERRGTATTLAIISTEESIKAFIVFLDSKGARFRRVKGMNKLFKDHKIRYWISYLLLIMGLLGEDLRLYLQSSISDPQKFALIMNKIKDDKVYRIRVLRIYIYKKMKLFREELIWISKMDRLRQDGLYCDYIDEIKTPQGITSLDYEKIYDRLNKIRLLSEGFFESCEKPEIDKLLNTILKSRDSNKIYTMIESALAILNKSDNLFANATEKFNKGLLQILGDKYFFAVPEVLEEINKSI